ncbi:class I SAM-dependent methyltransferase [Amycolatopsis sp. NPDC059027]|uniref:class I SAM-dependent methyltransferase n=1 Tax=Amycolatopsis sp. NPDC059027 TaxID=3346709 RepID=UPI0036702AE4
MQYGPDHAAIYDVVFRSRGKNFEREAAAITELVKERSPGATSILDVACGTGAHLAGFAELFTHAEGLEYAPAMREVARGRLPGLTVHAGDMRDFAIGRTFDAVTCMGNSVACMSTTAELDAAIGRMAAHLDTGGVLLVEPWWFPDNFLDGHVGGHLVTERGRVISRLTHSSRQGDRTRMEVRFVVADSTGFKEFTDVLMVSLFTREQYVAAFERAGCAVELLPALSLDGGRPNGPGLFAGVRK